MPDRATPDQAKPHPTPPAMPSPAKPNLDRPRQAVPYLPHLFYSPNRFLSAACLLTAQAGSLRPRNLRLIVVLVNVEDAPEHSPQADVRRLAI